MATIVVLTTTTCPSAAASLPAREVVPLDRRAPPLGLMSQHGRPLDLTDLRGRPVLVTFAFDHCQTVCPLVVREALAAQRMVPKRPPAVVVVTLDPWRDTASRLPAIARRWGLDEDGYVLSGAVDDVNDALDRWGIGRSRNRRNGDIVHVPVTFVVDPSGTITHRTGARADVLAALVWPSR